MDEILRPPLERAFESPLMSILGVLAESDRPLTASEIADQSTYARSTIYEHVDRLVELRLVDRHDDGRTTYTLVDGPDEAIMDLNRHLRPVVDDGPDRLVGHFLE